METSSPRLPLTHALAWIVGSMLFVNGIGYSCLKMVMKRSRNLIRHEEKRIRSIVQTGPQKEALKTEYLAEILGICAEDPPNISTFDVHSARDKLLSSPLIAHAEVSTIKPNILYIDYTVRQPIAYLADFDNVVIDKEGYPFPFSPFFSPKNLPQIYLGLASFAMPSSDADKPIAKWGHSLQGKHLHIALEILSFAADPKISQDFHIVWIDVSQAFSKTCGTREIVLVTHDTFFAAEVKHVFPRILRLSTKSYAQELGNYLKLRPQLLEEDVKKVALAQKISSRMIDFRIPNLAFVEETSD